MLAPDIECPNPDCPEKIQYWQSHCRCGHLVGFPNYRSAELERDVLNSRYEAARDDAAKRGVLDLLSKLEAVADQSRPVIAMSFQACDDILRPGKYRNYDERVESGERDPARELDHSNRAMVGEKLFPTYAKHIHYAALSPDGRGLPSYGTVAVRWQVTSTYLGRRTSLIETNSFTFYEQYELGSLDAEIPAGHQGIWEDRIRLVAAKLAGHLTNITSESSLRGLVMHQGVNRKDDEFVEIAIYAENGIDTKDVDAVTLHRVPATSEERHRWDLIRGYCAVHVPPISVIE